MTKRQIEKMRARQRRYMAAPGAPYNHAEAQGIGAELEQMAEEGLAITPSALVERAVPENSVLHTYFTWDNTVAADNYRKWEARTIVNHLIIITPQGEGEKRQKSHYSCTVVSEEEDDTTDREYVGVFSVMKQEALKRQAHVKAWAEIKAWASRWEPFEFEDMAELFAIVAAKSK